jgi:hypothetical protein
VRTLSRIILRGVILWVIFKLGRSIGVSDAIGELTAHDPAAGAKLVRLMRRTAPIEDTADSARWQKPRIEDVNLP